MFDMWVIEEAAVHHDSSVGTPRLIIGATYDHSHLQPLTLWYYSYWYSINKCLNAIHWCCGTPEHVLFPRTDAVRLEVRGLVDKQHSYSRT